jgi:hypothetical protein
MREPRIYQKVLAFGTVLVLFLMVFVGIQMNVSANEIETKESALLDGINDYDRIVTSWVEDEVDTPTGTKYMLYNNHGGWWADAEKAPGDDGMGNPAPNNPGDEDDLLCWAATVSNMLEWTGWGFVGGMEDDDTDEFLDYFEDHVTDYGSTNRWGIEWWFTGNLPTQTGDWSVEDVQGGNFWSSNYTFSNYLKLSSGNGSILPDIRTWMMNGYAIGLGIYPIGTEGGHAITCWGFNYNPSKNPATEPEDYYLGIWVTDSDSHKGQSNPDDVLRYYEVEWDSSKGYWYMPSYGSGWVICEVNALLPFPGESRPVAADGGPYIANEGSAVTFSGSGSTDDDTLRYRWDFDGDGDWDTSWSTSSSASNTWYDNYNYDVYLEVFDDRLRDMDVTTVTINNVAPTVTASGSTIDENGVATVSGTITDPGTLDTFSVVIDWGEGTPESFSYPAGSTTFSETHTYLDDNPTSTLYDIYTIGVTVTDDDGGVGTAGTTVTVNNVNPEIPTGSISQPNPQFILPQIHTVEFTGSFTDVGTEDTHTAIWDWGDSTSEAATVIESGGSGMATGSHIYMLPGIYTVTLTVTDDDGGYVTDTMVVEVVDAHGALNITNDYIQSLDNSVFKNNAAQRKKAYSNMIDALHHKVDAENYKGAIQMMQNNLKGKSDGSLGGKANNDWVIDPMVQNELTMKFDDISTYLALFL